MTIETDRQGGWQAAGRQKQRQRQRQRRPGRGREGEREREREREGEGERGRERQRETSQDLSSRFVKQGEPFTVPYQVREFGLAEVWDSSLCERPSQATGPMRHWKTKRR